MADDAAGKLIPATASVSGSRDPDDLNASLSTLLVEISGTAAAAAGGGDYKLPVKKESANLVRRLTLLSPFFDELKESNTPLSGEAAAKLAALAAALRSAKELLQQCQSAGKIWLVLQAKTVSDKFQEVTSRIAYALGGLPFDDLEISYEVREQVELVHAQLERAKDRIGNIPDEELLSDLHVVLRDSEADIEVLNRLAEKLSLNSVPEIDQEIQSLEAGTELSSSSDDDKMENMIIGLERLKKLVSHSGDSSGEETYANDGSLEEKKQIFLSGFSSIEETTSTKLEPILEKRPSSVSIPDDFRCPISLELMRDPVIVSTGQTYERSCIQKWIDSGHKTCPKTQQTLSHLVLTPNYVLRSLITQWCEVNGIKPPKKASTSTTSSSKSTNIDGLEQQEAPGDRAAIDELVWKLVHGSPEEQKEASGELRKLSKRNTDNRVCIAEAGAIPHLVKLLASNDLKTQEHAVTAVLNLSIYDNNKGAIVMAGAIPAVIAVVKSGSMEARENAAATLFSLSMVDENKIAIGASGAIPALVELLQEGSPRGKKDAATALFNLCIYPGNKARAVRANILTPLMELLVDSNSGMVDEALAIVAVLASNHEGKVAIAKANALPILVDLIRSGIPRNKENAAAILLALCKKDAERLAVVQRLGVYIPLSELLKNGTERAKRKAASLLELLSRMDK